jgi:nucleoside transporter
MSYFIKFQLSLMMFLQFFIWGSWFVTLGTFLSKNLDATGIQSSIAFSTQSWGAIIAPVFIGLIADKYFNAEKILGILHLIGGYLMIQLYQSTSFDLFYPLVFFYMVLYMPTLALVNSISFNQMKNPSKEFSSIRVFGTLGWIFSGIMISYFFGWDSKISINDGLLKNTFKMAAIASFALGILSFFLPKTPPNFSNKKSRKLKNILGLDALALLRDKNFLMFFITSILICIPLAFYYQQTNPFLVNIGMENPTGTMALGQFSEALFILLLPLFLKKFGFKITLIIGMFSWFLRYLLFAYGDVNDGYYLLILGIFLHGVCYDFFFVSGQIYTNFKAGRNFKSSAQGLITLATYGVGMYIGFWFAGFISDFYKIGLTFNWKIIWIFPSLISLFVMFLFIIIFRNEKIKTKN